MQYNVSDPFPVSEKLLCHFSTKLADDGLAPQTIKVYLSAIRSMQLSLGLPPPWEESTLPVLKRVLNGISRVRASGNRTPRIRMPIIVTIFILHSVLGSLSQTGRRSGLLPPQHSSVFSASGSY